MRNHKAAVSAAVLLTLCIMLTGHLNIPILGVPSKTDVSGRVVDTAGKPISGVAVHAVHRQLVGGNLHRAARWNKLIHKTEFTTDDEGQYRGSLDYADRSGIDWDDQHVFYFACKTGYRLAQVYFPKRDAIVLLRTDERAYWRGGQNYDEEKLQAEGVLQGAECP